MFNRYLACFAEAYKKYSAQDTRPGYLFGYFSWLRHSKTLYPHIANLQDNITHKNNDDEIIKILTNYFSDPVTTFNNHSFSIYFLDELLMTFPEEKNLWEKFYPAEKQLVFYKGILYRGMKIQQWQLEEFFNQGFDSRQSSEWVDAYANDTSMGLGISTSKDKYVAAGYASAMVSRGIREACTVIYQSGFLLEIDYDGEGGIDILETLKTRQDNVNYYFAERKKEVNIIGNIKPENIKGAYFIDPEVEAPLTKRPYFINPKYKPSIIPDNDNVVFPERLKSLFSLR